MNLFLSSDTAGSAIFLALIGGCIAILGLIIEEFASWLNKRFLIPHEEPHEKLRFIGWSILMFGICIETADAGWTAYEIRQANPWNGNISEISARAFIIVKGGATADLEPWGSPAQVASLIFCENNLEAQGDAALFAPLSANLFVRSGTVLIGKGSVRRRGYSLAFQSEGIEALMSEAKLPVSEINKVKIVKMYLKFLPKGSEILGGTSEIIVNGKIIGDFQILPQIDTNSADGTPNNPYEMLATNGVWRPSE